MHKFKQTEIGMIPEEWEVKKAEELVKVNEMYIGGNFQLDQIEYIDIDSVEGGIIKNVQMLNLENAPSRAKRIVKNEDIIISTVRPNLRHFAFIKNAKPNTIASTGFAVISCKNIHPKFFYYYVTTNKYTNYLSAIADSHTSTYPAFNPDVIENSLIPFPPLHEQRAIAKILSDLDAKIELNQQMNKTLEEIGKAIFKHWFVDFEFQNEEGKPYKSSGGEMVYNEELGKEIPKGWRVEKITKIIKRESVSYKCDKKDLDPKGATPILDQGSTCIYGYTSRRPDFTATRENPVIVFANHTCNYWFIDYPFCAIQNVIPFRGKDGYDEYFLYFMTKGSVTFIEYKGHWPDFEAKDFLIPPVEIAIRFGKVAKTILRKMSFCNSQTQTLSQIRDCLLPKLMSGKIRVPLEGEE